MYVTSGTLMTSRTLWLAAIGNGPIIAGRQSSPSLLYEFLGYKILGYKSQSLFKVAEHLHLHFPNSHHRASRDGKCIRTTNGLRHLINLESTYRL